MSLEEDIEDIRWREFWRRIIRNDNDACGYSPPEVEDAESEGVEETPGDRG